MQNRNHFKRVMSFALLLIVLFSSLPILDIPSQAAANVALYSDDWFGWYECFLTSDVNALQNMNVPVWGNEMLSAGFNPLSISSNGNVVSTLRHTNAGWDDFVAVTSPKSVAASQYCMAVDIKTGGQYAISDNSGLGCFSIGILSNPMISDISMTSWQWGVNYGLAGSEGYVITFNASPNARGYYDYVSIYRTYNGNTEILLNRASLKANLVSALEGNLLIVKLVDNLNGSYDIVLANTNGLSQTVYTNLALNTSFVYYGAGAFCSGYNGGNHSVTSAAFEIYPNYKYEIPGEERYKLVFDPEGGKMPEGYNTEYIFKSGQNVSELIENYPIPKREGYTFLYWQYGITGYYPDIDWNNFIFSYEKDVTFTAVWQPNEYLLTFDPAGGEMPEGYNTEYVFKTGEKFLDVIGKYPIPTKEGSDFKYWLYGMSGYSPNCNWDNMVYDFREDIKFTACWEDHEYKLTFDTADGKMPEGYSDSYSFKYGEKLLDIIGNYPVPTRSGYIFNRWTLDNTTVLNSDDWTDYVYIYYKDVSVVAEWIPETYTVTFDPNGDLQTSCDTESISVVYGEEYGTLPIPERVGYTFEGWYTEPENGVKINELTLCKTASNHTLYAHWTPKSYTLIFDLGGGEMPEGYNLKYTFIQDELFVDIIGGYPVPTRSGYIFAGWRRTDWKSDFWVDGWGTQPFTFGHDVILRAEWEKLTLTAVSIATMPIKTEYFVGEKLNTEGLVLTLYYNDNTTKTITNGFTVSGFSSYTAGIKTLTVSYGDKETTFEVKVKEKSAIGISVSPSKLEYYLNEVFDAEKLTVQINYDNGQSLTTMNYKVTGFDSSKPGKCFVNIECSGYSSGFEVTVLNECVPGSHLWGTWNIIEKETCQKQGKIIRYCQNCASYESGEIAVSDHVFEDYTFNNDSSCTKDGTKTAVCIFGCGTLDTIIATGSATGHDYKAVVTPPTCTEKGYTVYTCHCGDSYTDDMLNALGHKGGESVQENIIASSCTEKGSYDKVVYCTVCKTELSRKHIETDVLGHDYIDHEGKDATCTEEGYKAYQTCTRCDYTSFEKIPAKGHDYKAAVTAPTCEAKGYTTYTCKNDATHTYVDNYVSALGHNYEVTEHKDATCTEDGYDVYTCKNDANHSYTTMIEKLGHKGGESVQENVVGSNCTDKGSYDEVIYCTVCKTELSRKHIETEILGHDYVDHEGKDATCTEDGYKAYQTCTRCDYTSFEKIPAKGHDYKAAVTEPTCTEKGYTEYTCHCGECYTDDYTDKLGHSFTSYVSNGDASCIKDGTETAKCDRCDATDTRADKDSALGHTEGKAVQENVVGSNCTDKGSYDEVIYCTVCKTELSRKHIETDVLGHDYIDHEGKDATCTEEGYKAYQTCTRCDYTSFEKIPAKGHDYIDHEGKDATCTEDGYKAYQTCTRCDYTSFEKIPAKGHDYIDHEGKDATCTEEGYKAYQTCTRCDYTSFEKTPAKGHDYIDHEGKDATCTEEGYKAYQTCTRCDYTSFEKIPAKGHDYKAAVTEPTCTEKGYTEYTCHCGECYTDDYTDKLGHSFTSYVSNGDASCTEDGTETAKCDRCDVKDTRADKDSALGHTEGKAVQENVVGSNCTDKGSYDEVIYCTVCKTELSRKHIETDVLGHDYIDHEGKDATCTEDGYKAYQTCSRCDYTSFEKIPAKGHDYKAAVTEPTCTEKGYTEYTCHCGECYTDDYTDKLGHSFTSYVSNGDASCTEDGTETAKCDRCDVKDTRADKDSALGHTEGKAVQENVIGSNCTDKGSYDEVIYCTVCKTELSRKHIETDVLGHDYIDHEGKDATCTEDGYKAYQTCSRCDYTSFEKIPAKGHDYKAAVTVPTCEAKGYTTYTCKNDATHTYVDNYVSALGHNYEVTEHKDATCTEDGYDVYTCKNDANHSYTTMIEKLGHSYEAVVTAPTCTDAGYTTYTCTVCGDSYTDDMLNALGHKGGESVQENIIASSCTEKGSYDKVVYCTVCKTELSRKHIETDVLGHDYIDHEGKDATCTEEGYKAYQTCTRCDYTSFEKIPAKGHDYKAAVTEPTCTENGYTEYTCHCGECYTDDYTDKLGHSFTSYVSNGDASCTEDGTETAKCDRCDVKDTRVEKDSANGHKAGNWVVLKEATFKEEGEQARYCNICSELLEIQKIPVVVINRFPDVPDDAWYAEGVYYCASKGYITGTDAGTFNPNGKLTREQFVVILARVAGADLSGYTISSFDDVSASIWYGPSVIWAYENGYVNGVDDGSKFGVGRNMTREQLATMFYRYAEKNGVSVSNKADLSIYNDVNSIGDWAKDGCAWAVDIGLLGSTSTNTKTLSPKMPVTRAQAAKIFMSYDTYAK